MNFDNLAQDAVTAFAERLASGAADALTTAIGDHLGRTRTGARALSALRADSTAAAGRELATDVLTDELARDPHLVTLLSEALRRPVPAPVVTVAGNATVHGDVAGGNIDKSRRFHIGSIRFGGGGLATLIAAVLLGGGAGVGIYQVVTTPRTTAAGPPAVSASPATATFGTWRQGLSGQSTDLDARGQPERGGDSIADLTFDYETLRPTGGARLAPLGAGIPPGQAACDQALRAAAADSQPVKLADVICVRTSAGGLAAVTVSQMKHVNEDTTFASTIYRLDYSYWAASR